MPGNRNDNDKNKQGEMAGHEAQEDVGFESGNEQGDLTVREAGQRGGQRVRELVEEGEEHEREGGREF